MAAVLRQALQGASNQIFRRPQHTLSTGLSLAAERSLCVSAASRGNSLSTFRKLADVNIHERKLLEPGLALFRTGGFFNHFGVERPGSLGTSKRSLAPAVQRDVLAPPLGARGFAVFGFPPQKATKRYTGIHCHPGMLFGYRHPRKRQGKVRRLPNIRYSSVDYQLAGSSDGQFYLRPPYPPHVNRTIEVTPPWGARKNPWPTTVHKQYRLRWRNIEYNYVPQLTRKPHGSASNRWTGPVTRIEHLPGGKTNSQLVTHDARLLDW
eukprot:TRINITY_DN63203_c0_g1_i1.p1 TRINITY_DN63203_c0_g1~~TRINITY_DN63203_c0_g1_i1.p1  ORF type:complete len:278 (+),score=25.32 TRINITY_DN63203_c0_g1_i1:42-836(+)